MLADSARRTARQINNRLNIEEQHMPAPVTLGEPPEAMPIWARLQLAELGHPFRAVTHWIRSGDTIGAAVRGQAVWLRKD